MFSFSNETDDHINKAAYRLVEQMDRLTHEAVKGLAAADEYVEEDCLPLPMWGTLWQVSDSCDKRSIKALCVSMIPTDEDEADTLNDDNGLGIDKPDFQTPCGECDKCKADEEDECEDAELDEDGFVQAVIDEWRDSGQEDAQFADSGWMSVGDTGIIALEVYDELVLGIDGCGYAFADSHWIPLYKELGYGWHRQYAREARIGEASRAVSEAFGNLNGARERIPVRLRAALLELAAAYSHDDPGE